MTLDLERIAALQGDNLASAWAETLRWVDWFNNHRLFGPIGHIPPAEAEANYYAANKELDKVA